MQHDENGEDDRKNQGDGNPPREPDPATQCLEADRDPEER